MRHSEGSGEWDGVDIATAPYLQEYVASSGKEGMPLTSPCAASGAIQAGIGVDGVASPASRDDIKLDNCRGGRDGKLLPNRPSTPPALLTFGECSR